MGQILRMDQTMTDVKFGYTDDSGTWRPVTTLEEDEYPAYYDTGNRRCPEQDLDEQPVNSAAGVPAPPTMRGPVAETAPVVQEKLFEGLREFQENQKGISFNMLLAPYLHGATEITIADPYIRQFHQARNLMELIGSIATIKEAGDEVTVVLATTENSEGEDRVQRQLEYLLKIQESAAVAGIKLEVKLDDTIHDRSIRSNTGWMILLGRGLDIFQYFPNDAFDLANNLQEYRQVKAFGVTYICDNTQSSRRPSPTRAEPEGLAWCLTCSRAHVLTCSRAHVEVVCDGDPWAAMRRG